MPPAAAKRVISLSAVVLLVSVFGPYVFPAYSIRLEQIIAYPLAAVILLSHRASISSAPAELRRIVLLWCTLLSVSVAVSLWNGRDTASVLAGVDDYLLPMCAVVVTLAFEHTNRRLRAYKLDGADRLLVWICLLLCLNTAVAILQTRQDLNNALKPFWTGATPDWVTATGENAARMGRLVGLFNQPAETGLAYSIGLFVWVLLWRQRRRTVLLVSVLTGLLIGGFLGNSKVFLLGGLPLFVLVLLLRGRKTGWLIAALCLSAALYGITYLSVGPHWQGSLSTVQWLKQDDPVVAATAGRFTITGEGQFATLFHRIWDESPVIGVGFGGLDAVDSSLIYVFMSAGLIGVGLHIGIFFELFRGLLGLRRAAATPERVLPLVFFAFLCLASVGIPVLCVNRASTLTWVFVTTLLLRSPTMRAASRTARIPDVAGSCGLVSLRIYHDEGRTGLERPCQYM